MEPVAKYKHLVAILITSFLTLAPIASRPLHADVTEKGLFGMLEISSDNLAALPRWLNVKASFPNLADAAAKCDARIEDCRSQQMTLWRTKIAELQQANKRVQLQKINRFLNGWKHIPEDDKSNSPTQWVLPLDFVTNGGGPQDFAVMKYASLKELGFDPDNMRIVIANDVLRNRAHAILSVKLHGRSYILDSLNDTLLDERLVNYYVPLYSVNEKTRWAHIPQEFLIAQGASGSDKND